MTMIYAIFGIPLMLLCLANIGSTMADAFRFIYCNICCSYCNMVKKRRNLRALQSVELSHNTPSLLPSSPTTTTLTSNTLPTPPSTFDQPPPTNVVEFVDNLSIDYRKVTIPISVTLSLLSSYLILGAVLFSEWENWKFLDGAYFCFVTLATIGLGKWTCPQPTGHRHRSRLSSSRRFRPRKIDHVDASRRETGDLCPLCSARSLIDGHVLQSDAGGSSREISPLRK